MTQLARIASEEGFRSSSIGPERDLRGKTSNAQN